MGSNNGHRQHTADHYHRGEETNKDGHHRSSFRHNGHQQGNKDVHQNNFSRRLYGRINEVESGSEYNSECSAMSDIEEHLEEEDEPVPASIKTKLPFSRH